MYSLYKKYYCSFCPAGINTSAYFQQYIINIVADFVSEPHKESLVKFVFFLLLTASLVCFFLTWYWYEMVQ